MGKVYLFDHACIIAKLQAVVSCRQRHLPVTFKADTAFGHTANIASHLKKKCALFTRWKWLFFGKDWKQHISAEQV